jgi:hypothetical protein
MTKGVTTHTRWVLTWTAGSRRPNGNYPDSPQGDALAVFPGRTSRERLEGALEALFQLIGGSDADTQMSQSGKKPGHYEVEWDAGERNAKIGHDLMVWAHHSKVSYDRSRATLDETSGIGRITFVATSKWQTRDEYFAELRAARRAKGLGH